MAHGILTMNQKFAKLAGLETTYFVGFMRSTWLNHDQLKKVFCDC